MSRSLRGFDSGRRRTPRRYRTYTGAEGRRRAAQARGAFSASAALTATATAATSQGLGLWLFASTGRHAAS